MMRVMMIGTDTRSRGGISSVIKSYKDAGIMRLLRIKYYATHCEGTKLKKILFYLKAFPIIIKEMRKFRIIHVHTASRWSYRRLFPILFIAKILNKKIIIHLHGGMFGQYYDKAIIVEKIMIKFGFSIADIILILTSRFVDHISKFCNLNKVKVIPNGLPLNKLDDDNNEKKLISKPIILFMGNISAKKGIYDLIDAFKILIDKNKNLMLALCGLGEISRVKGYINKLNLDNFVYLTGWINQSNKKFLLENSFVFVLPSYFEILPMSIIEALAYGLPTISTKIGGIPDAIENGKQGFLIKPGDINALENSIQMLLDNISLWRKMRISARNKFEENFSTDIICKRLADLYSSL